MSFNVLQLNRNGVFFNVSAETAIFQSFWKYVFHDWEQETFAIFDRFLSDTSSYMDVGAWIGPTVLYAAQKAKHVYAFEPDPVAYRELIGNLQLNPGLVSKITCFNQALTTSSGTTRLYIRDHTGDSSSSIIPTSSITNFNEVRGVTITQLDFLQHINFIKMDIEAGEYLLIPSMRKYLKKTRPTLYLSLHPPFLKDQMKVAPVKGFNSDSECILFFAGRLLDSLSFYKHIYDARGTLVDRSAIVRETGFSCFLFTDECW
jgi:FkbM family methyltransferase